MLPVSASHMMPITNACWCGGALTGTEGPGAGVDWVTVVIARPWEALGGLDPAAAVVEAASELLAPSAPSSVCWAGNTIQRS